MYNPLKKLSSLPNEFVVSCENGFICVSCKLTSRADITPKNIIVDNWCKENKLDVIGSGTDYVKFVRTWCFEKDVKK